MKILAIGRFPIPPTTEQRQAIIPKEIPATLRLILTGQIEQFWMRLDWGGVFS